MREGVCWHTPQRHAIDGGREYVSKEGPILNLEEFPNQSVEFPKVT
jgi:hypothetical protein